MKSKESILATIKLVVMASIGVHIAIVLAMVYLGRGMELGEWIRTTIIMAVVGIDVPTLVFLLPGVVSMVIGSLFVGICLLVALVRESSFNGPDKGLAGVVIIALPLTGLIAIETSPLVLAMIASCTMELWGAPLFINARNLGLITDNPGKLLALVWLIMIFGGAYAPWVFAYRKIAIK